MGIAAPYIVGDLLIVCNDVAEIDLVISYKPCIFVSEFNYITLKTYQLWVIPAQSKQVIHLARL